MHRNSMHIKSKKRKNIYKNLLINYIEYKLILYLYILFDDGAHYTYYLNTILKDKDMLVKLPNNKNR